MIGISKLYCGTVEPSDALRYGRSSAKLPSHLLQFSADKKPVVVWNVTRRCNLHCVHCYSESRDLAYTGELTTAEGMALIDDLAAFGSPVLLFSGGEPLMRPDLIDLVRHATDRGMRAVISTNGTLITPETARVLGSVGLSYVGISIDGLRTTHDRFRGRAGAFDEAMAAVARCREAGIKVGLRFTITRHNAPEVDGVFDLIEQMDIPRICFYHLVYSGRGGVMQADDLTHDETRHVVDRIIDRTRDLHRRGQPREVLTVDNHADGVYLYLRLLQEDPDRAARVMELLRMNSGNSTGVGIGCVSWDGTVYPDQFWRNQPVGNVRERPFSQIWTDPAQPLLARLREKKHHVQGRCSLCQYLDVCGGNCRARAEAVTANPWAADPACYLSDLEIGLEQQG